MANILPLFLIVIGVFVTLLVASYAFARKRASEPVPLNMRVQGAPFRNDSQTLVPVKVRANTQAGALHLTGKSSANSATNSSAASSKYSGASAAANLDFHSETSRHESSSSRRSRYSDFDVEAFMQSSSGVHEKTLNVIFNYNGHSWDAFEVLGLPAGSSKEEARVAFEKMKAGVATESQEFLTAALDSILRAS